MFDNLINEDDSIPDSQKGETNKQSQRSTQFRDEGHQRINQSFLLYSYICCCIIKSKPEEPRNISYNSFLIKFLFDHLYPFSPGKVLAPSTSLYSLYLQGIKQPVNLMIAFCSENIILSLFFQSHSKHSSKDLHFGTEEEAKVSQGVLQFSFTARLFMTHSWKLQSEDPCTSEQNRYYTFLKCILDLQNFKLKFT